MWCASDLTDHQEEQRYEEGRARAAQPVGRALRFVLREKKNHPGEIQARDTWLLRRMGFRGTRVAAGKTGNANRGSKERWCQEWRWRE